VGAVSRLGRGFRSRTEEASRGCHRVAQGRPPRGRAVVPAVLTGGDHEGRPGEADRAGSVAAHRDGGTGLLPRGTRRGPTRRTMCSTASRSTMSSSGCVPSSAGLRPDDERFHAKVRMLIENVRYHVMGEERDLFPAVRAALGPRHSASSASGWSRPSMWRRRIRTPDCPTRLPATSSSAWSSVLSTRLVTPAGA
jgi:hypothetical protein